MTLRDYLESLPSDPGDASSPPLLVGEDVLTPEQREEIIGANYGRRPFVVLYGLPRGVPRHLHSGQTRLTGAIDVLLHHPQEDINGDTLAALQAKVLTARDEVDEIRDGYPLEGSLTLVSEIDPQRRRLENLDGLTAATRFAYSIWR